MNAKRSSCLGPVSQNKIFQVARIDIKRTVGRSRGYQTGSVADPDPDQSFQDIPGAHPVTQ